MVEEGAGTGLELQTSEDAELCGNSADGAGGAPRGSKLLLKLAKKASRKKKKEIRKQGQRD